MSFVRNTWYVAAQSAEVEAGPVARTILGEPVVLFRTEAGEPGALSDVCPHRAAPLHLGNVTGNRIRCPYHALEFDRDGICRVNPHVKGPPDRISTRAYPAVDRYGWLWIWPGDANLADPDAIPDYSWFTDAKRFTTGRGYTFVEADYRLVIDNLMDLAHAEYLHPNTVGSPGAAGVQQAEIVKDGGSITVKSLWPDLPPSAVYQHVWTKSERVDQYQDMTWRNASNLFLDLGIMPPGTARSDGWHTPSAHILTPETERSTHYFWAFGRDFDMDNEETTAAIVELVGIAFGTEDKPMIEAAQRYLDQTGARLRSFTIGDSGSGQVRREIERLAGLERENATTTG